MQLWRWQAIQINKLRSIYQQIRGGQAALKLYGNLSNVYLRTVAIVDGSVVDVCLAVLLLKRSNVMRLIFSPHPTVEQNLSSK